VKLRWMFAWLLRAVLFLSAALMNTAMQAQSVQSGSAVLAGAFVSPYADEEGGPLTYSARTDMAIFGAGGTGELLPGACAGNVACLANAYNPSATTGHQGAALSYTGSATQAPPSAGNLVSGTNINGLNSYLSGVNSTAMPAVDPDFGTPMFRATDASFYSSVDCLGGGNFGVSFNMGSSGSTRVWAPDLSKLLIQTSGGTKVMVAFDPATGRVTPTNLCGGYLPGATTFSGTSTHTIYTANNDQENTIVFSATTGTPTDAETLVQANTGATATLYAVNSNFIQVSPVGPANKIANNTDIWTGQTSGATFTPDHNYPAPGTGASGTPYANTIYKGVLTDSDTSGDYRRWSVSWSLIFNFNYVPAMAGDSHFPAAQNSCLPQNYGANYTGVFEGSDDDTSFSIAYSDNGQSNHTGYSTYGDPITCTGAIGAGAVGNSGSHVCTGPVYVANFRQGYGCRALNSMSDQIAGDWGPTGQLLHGQARMIPISSATGTPTPYDIFIQDVTGAETQLNCMQDTNGQCVSSGWQGGFGGWTKAFTGLIYTNVNAADSSHPWRDCGVDGTHCATTGASNYFTPSAVPAYAPFYYPDVLHDATSLDNPQLTNFSMVQQPDMKVTQIAYNHATHQTTVTYTNNATYSPGQQFIFFGLAAPDLKDAYLNCGSAAQCPVWTAVAGGDGSPTGGTLTIADNVGGTSDFTDTEDPAAATMNPWGQGSFVRTGYVGGNFWQTRTLVVNPNLGATGHSARGYNYNYQGKYYQAYNMFNPSTPATEDGSPGGLIYGPSTNVADAETPPPGSNVPKLLPFNVVDDQHGSNWGHGTTDLSPVGLVSALVCGQAGAGVGGFPCPAQYLSIWDSELFAIENATARSSPGVPIGLDCNYGAGPAPCVYRLGHTFNTDDNWNFNGQNAIGIMSPDGNWLAFPSDWNKTVGCMDMVSTNCWSSWEATANAANGTNTAWSVDSNSNVTITMPNSFCPTGGTQAWAGGGTVNCGTRAGTVTLTGFAESWLNNQVLSLGANVSNNWGCASGTCSAFIGTVANACGGTPPCSGTEATGTQKATPTGCGGGAPCQRQDIWIAKISAAHQ